MDALQSYIWRRHLVSASSRMLLRPADQESCGAGGRLRGHRRLHAQSRNLSDSDLVALVEHFEEVAASTVTDHGGRMIKTIGDEVLYVADRPTARASPGRWSTGPGTTRPSRSCVRAWPTGPVVSRLGDVFGPTVNIASRLTSLSRPGKVLVDKGMRDALAELDPDESEFRLSRVRRTR